MVRTAELQEQPSLKVESQVTSNVQREALDLLSVSNPTIKDTRGLNVTGRMLEFSNIFDMTARDSRSNSLPERSNGTCQIAKPDCSERKQFTPDYQLRTRAGREWQGRSQEQRQKPLGVDQEGKYQVQKGDSLWTLGERMARGKDGRKADSKLIERNVKRLLEENPELKCNPNLLREGTKLRIPKNDVTSTPESGTGTNRQTKPQEKTPAPAKPQDRNPMPGKSRDGMPTPAKPQDNFLSPTKPQDKMPTPAQPQDRSAGIAKPQGTNPELAKPESKPVPSEQPKPSMKGPGYIQIPDIYNVPKLELNQPERSKKPGLRP